MDQRKGAKKNQDSLLCIQLIRWVSGLIVVSLKWIELFWKYEKARENGSNCHAEWCCTHSTKCGTHKMRWYASGSNMTEAQLSAPPQHWKSVPSFRDNASTLKCNIHTNNYHNTHSHYTHAQAHLLKQAQRHSKIVYISITQTHTYRQPLADSNELFRKLNAFHMKIRFSHFFFSRNERKIANFQRNVRYIRCGTKIFRKQFFFLLFVHIDSLSSFAAFVFYDSFACSMAHTRSNQPNISTHKLDSFRDWLTQCHRFFFLSLLSIFIVIASCMCLVSFLYFSVDYFVSVELCGSFFFLHIFSFCLGSSIYFDNNLFTMFQPNYTDIYANQSTQPFNTHSPKYSIWSE